MSAIHSHNRSEANLARCVIVASLLFLLGGCVQLRHIPVLLFILLDETTSFVESGNWDKSLSISSQAVALLKPRDQVCVIGIDHHGFDQNDIRIPLTVLPSASLKAAQQKKQLIQQIIELQPRDTSSGWRLPDGKIRGTPLGTDQLGALAHAAHFATLQRAISVKVLTFSDFQDEPVETGIGKNPQPFPADTSFLALHVVDKEGEGQEMYSRRVSRWVDKLRILHISCRPEDFLAPGVSRQPEVIQNFLNPQD